MQSNIILQAAYGLFYKKESWPPNSNQDFKASPLPTSQFQ